jgi:hypothetical protein
VAVVKDAPRRPGRYPNLHRGQTQKHDDTPVAKKVYTTARPDGILVAHDSRPVGFGPTAEEWDLNI